ncbi:hypothetical protein V8C35DRAFT_187444 [Trichoderma chlorosporum]
MYCKMNAWEEPEDSDNDSEAQATSTSTNTGTRIRTRTRGSSWAGAEAGMEGTVTGAGCRSRIASSVAPCDWIRGPSNQLGHAFIRRRRGSPQALANTGQRWGRDDDAEMMISPERRREGKQMDGRRRERGGEQSAEAEHRSLTRTSKQATLGTRRNKSNHTANRARSPSALCPVPSPSRPSSLRALFNGTMLPEPHKRSAWSYCIPPYSPRCHRSHDSFLQRADVW